MPNYDVNVRRDWFLPLVGGAELNRIKLPKPIIFTSRPYPVEIEDLATTFSQALDTFSVDAADFTQTTVAQVVAIALREQYQLYDSWPADTVKSTITSVLSMSLNSAYNSYTLWAPDTMQTAKHSVLGMTLATSLIMYTRWATEELQTSMHLVTGMTLT